MKRGSWMNTKVAAPMRPIAASTGRAPATSTPTPMSNSGSTTNESVSVAWTAKTRDWWASGAAAVSATRAEGDRERHDERRIEAGFEVGKGTDLAEGEDRLEAVIERREREDADDHRDERETHDLLRDIGRNRSGGPGKAGEDADSSGSNEEDAPLLAEGDVVAEVEGQGDHDALDDHGLHGKDSERIAGHGGALEHAEGIAQGRVVAGGFARRLAVAEGEGDGDGGEDDATGQRAREHRLGAADDKKEGRQGKHASALSGVLQGNAERVGRGASLATEHADHGHFRRGIDLGDRRVGEDHTGANRGGVEFEETECDDTGAKHGTEGHAAPWSYPVGKRAAHDAEEEGRRGGRNE